MDDREQKVRALAHKIWEDEGQPEGGHDHHWRRAEEHYASSERADGEENWRVEAGLTDDKPALDITSTVVTPD